MITRLGICLAMLALSFVGFAEEHGQSEETVDLREISCQELTTMPEEDQGYVLVLIFGYAAGENKKPIQSSASIESQITAAHHQCASSPDITILDAMVAATPGTKG